MEQLSFNIIDTTDKLNIEKISQFLERNNLRIDSSVRKFMVVVDQGNIIAVGGVAIGGILKCIAVENRLRGEGVLLQLITHLINLSSDLGYNNPFVFTKPENEQIFKHCGFYPIEKLSKEIILMENSPFGILNYCDQLRKHRVSGDKIGSIVMNADPFTLGHRYLIEQALKKCDHLHVFLLEEEASYFSFNERHKMLCEGTADLTSLTIHKGGRYIISRATFPEYFIKEKADIERTHMELDLRIFRRYIAPSLNINTRFVGHEPFCQLTNAYNESMRKVLFATDNSLPKIEVIEISRRKGDDDQFISASRVRDFYKRDKINEIEQLVPRTTHNHLEQKTKERHNILS